MTALSFWDIGSISHGRITAMRSSSSAVSTPTLATTARRLSRPPERKGPSEELRPRAQRLSYANATSLRKCAARDQNPKRVRFSPGDCAVDWPPGFDSSTPPGFAAAPVVSLGVVFSILSPPVVVLGAAVLDPPFTAGPEEVPAVASLGERKGRGHRKSRC